MAAARPTAQPSAQLLAELSALSSEIERAAIVDASGVVLAAIPLTEGERLASGARELLDAAPRSGGSVEYLEVGLASGSVFVAQVDGRLAVATTGPEPASALVLHDLRSALQRLATGAGRA